MFCSPFLKIAKKEDKRDWSQKSNGSIQSSPSRRHRHYELKRRNSTAEFDSAEKGNHRNKENKKQIDDDSIISTQSSLHEGSDAHKYLSKREMTAVQERVNGLTNIPASLYCLLYVLSGTWLTPSIVDSVRYESWTNEVSLQEKECISISWLPNLHAMAPFPIIAVALAVNLHGPFSLIYHYKYAPSLPTSARIDHWSRRMDQVMMHVYSSLIAYALSGSPLFILLLTLFNIDCIYRQFLKEVIPRRNQTRLVISILACSIPMISRGDYQFFCKLYFVKALGFAIFATYPFGGWSHAVFHLIFLLTPPMMMNYVTDLPATSYTWPPFNR